jgi:hypothetical protein
MHSEVVLDAVHRHLEDCYGIWILTKLVMVIQDLRTTSSIPQGQAISCDKRLEAFQDQTCAKAMSPI